MLLRRGGREGSVASSLHGVEEREAIWGSNIKEVPLLALLLLPPPPRRGSDVEGGS